MSRFGKEQYRDEDSWGERTSCDNECSKWEREWRRDSLATKGLRDFDGTGEGVQEGVAYTEAMYEDQVTGINMGNRRK